jgi:hypothetical protein
VVNKGYQQLFRHYEPQEFNLESVFSMHLTESIVGEMPRQPSDYVLRAYFSKQMDFAE